MTEKILKIDVCANRRPGVSGASQPGIRLKRAAVAQMVEHVIRNDGAGGSSPLSGTTFPFSKIRWRPECLVVYRVLQ